jgi:hypothetical protein
MLSAEKTQDCGWALHQVRHEQMEEDCSVVRRNELHADPYIDFKLGCWVEDLRARPSKEYTIKSPRTHPMSSSQGQNTEQGFLQGRGKWAGEDLPRTCSLFRLQWWLQGWFIKSYQIVLWPLHYPLASLRFWTDYGSQSHWQQPRAQGQPGKFLHPQWDTPRSSFQSTQNTKHCIKHVTHMFIHTGKWHPLPSLSHMPTATMGYTYLATEKTRRLWITFTHEIKEKGIFGMTVSKKDCKSDNLEERNKNTVAKLFVTLIQTEWTSVSVTRSTAHLRCRYGLSVHLDTPVSYNDASHYVS